MYLIPSRGDWTALALAVLAPYVYVSSLRPSGRSALPLPPRLRSWLAGAVAEEEQELSGAIYPERGGLRDAVLALAVVVVASAALERTVSTLGARWAVPGVITGGIVLAAVTSMPNAVAAVFLARRGWASATLSEAFNSNTLNVIAGLFIPAVIIASPGPGGACELPSGTASSPSPPKPCWLAGEQAHAGGPFRKKVAGRRRRCQPVVRVRAWSTSWRIWVIRASTESNRSVPRSRAVKSIAA